jgi:hypothetical protein
MLGHRGVQFGKPLAKQDQAVELCLLLSCAELGMLNVLAPTRCVGSDRLNLGAWLGRDPNVPPGGRNGQ